MELIAPQFVKPYVKSNKNDANDAGAICEAMSRPNMRFVAVKTVEQIVIQAVHGVRSGLMDQRKAKANQLRGLASEHGLVAPRELLHLRSAIPRWLEDQENGLSERFRRLLRGLWRDLLAFDECIEKLDPGDRTACSARPNGCTSATSAWDRAAYCAGNAGNGWRCESVFQRSEIAAWFGLTPKQNSSGGKERLLGISKRGEAYLRSLLVNGVRAVIRTAQAKTDRLSAWIMRIAMTRHPNFAAVALANETARIVWAMLTKGTDYRP